MCPIIRYEFKSRAASGSMNRKEENTATDISAKLKKGYFNKNFKEAESDSNTKRSSLHRVKRVNKIPLGKRDSNIINNPRSSSRSKQLSAKNRLVYKKDSMKTLNSNNSKNEMILGSSIPSGSSKIENKENEFMQANSNLKLNRTSSGRETQKSIKSMSSIRKLYTLKANNTNRKLESQSHSNSIMTKKRQHKLKVSSSETPKLRSQNEELFTGVRVKLTAKNSEVQKENSNEGENTFVSNYDERLLRKPPNPNSSLKVTKHNNYLKRPTTKHQDDSDRKINTSMERDREEERSENTKVDEEAAKRQKVQDQILNHLKTGNLTKDAIITPIMSNDGQIRQYILNDPISNPEEAEEEIPLIPGHKITNTTVDKSKCSTRKNGVVKAYSANTNKGIIRNYNEDRVSIILNILKPNSRKGEDWPKCSFFGVFDGHGGAACADFLRDNLHQFVIKESSFPNDPEDALMKGFLAAERVFIENAQQNGEVIEKSGS